MSKNIKTELLIKFMRENGFDYIYDKHVKLCFYMSEPMMSYDVWEELDNIFGEDFTSSYYKALFKGIQEVC